MINMAFVGAISETDEPTQEQEKKYQEQLKLSPEKRENYKINETKQIRGGGLTHISAGGDFKNCKQCGVSHFIPSEKGICLGCVGKNVFVRKLKL